ncbi:hypothetical protein [Streptomyces sp. NPDC049585]|uniref:hypothetical protein n=1 Tax=Streptomyces sp. NPDC049585 TaxID=3155154 RepID=UPI0034357453
MTTKDILSYVVPLMVPIVTAAVGGVGLAVKDHKRRRSVDQLHRERLETARMEVEFLSGWLQMRQQLAPSPVAAARVQDWLEKCYTAAEATPQEEARPITVKRLLLLRHLMSPAARFARVLYWIALFAVNLYGVMGGADVITGAQGPDALTLGDTVTLVLVFGAIAVICRAWCVSAEKRWHHARENPPATPESSGRTT